MQRLTISTSASVAHYEHAMFPSLGVKIKIINLGWWSWIPNSTRIQWKEMLVGKNSVGFWAELLGQILGRKLIGNLPGKGIREVRTQMHLSATTTSERELILATIHESAAASTARGNVVRRSNCMNFCPLTHSQKVAESNRSSRVQI